MAGCNPEELNHTHTSRAIAKNNDVLSTRHSGESRGPVPRAVGLKRLDSGVRRNDGIRPPRIRRNFWQLIYVSESAETALLFVPPTRVFEFGGRIYRRPLSSTCLMATRMSLAS